MRQKTLKISFVNMSVSILGSMAILGCTWTSPQESAMSGSSNTSQKSNTATQLSTRSNLDSVTPKLEKLNSLSTLEQIKRSGKLTVLTRYAPTIYYEGPEGAEGFEYSLVSRFAEYLGVSVELRILDGVAEVLQAIKEGEGDIAAAALTRTRDREKQYLFGPGYYDVQQEVVCRRGRNVPKQLRDLIGLDILVTEGSSYAAQLKRLQEELPQLSWRETDLPTEQVLAKVWDKEIDCTVADSNIVAINRRYYPELIVPFAVSLKEPLAWVLRDGATDLQKALEEWLSEFKHTKHMASLIEHHYGHVQIFDYVDTAVYHRRINNRLPKFERLFKEAEAEYDIPWSLLAAQAYQESHWDRLAKSPTGVRGMMMLTLKTASSLGIKDRLNVEQSIMGGAQYLSQLIRTMPKEIVPKDRLRFALAAYNVGIGHLQDARELTRKLGKDPNHWSDVKYVLPLLAQKRYYSQLRHGYARGTEPVRYVERIYNYHDMLQQILGAPSEAIGANDNLERSSKTL